ncbi:FAD-binding protein [Massilia sp. B-10]|nr:FAD-binding protein [Massilia sp. B-10]
MRRRHQRCLSHLTVPDTDTPVLTINMARMRAAQPRCRGDAGDLPGRSVFGPDLEAQLRTHGFTLGHFPQSFEYSTLGGWVVTRSSGQQSLRYGRIEQLFAGGRVETPANRLDLPTFPASAAGTDLREMVLGSEGRLGVLTEATVRITPLLGVRSLPRRLFPGLAKRLPGHAPDRAGQTAAVDAAPVQSARNHDHADPG